MADESQAPFPLQADLNPAREIQQQMRFKCFKGATANGNYQEVFTNNFQVDIQCQGSTYASLYTTNWVSRIVQAGYSCEFMAKDIAMACASSITAYKSSSDMISQVSHHTSGATNIANLDWQYVYFQGVTSSELRDEADWKFQLQVTETDANGGGTYWTPQYSLYCDPCIYEAVNVLSTYSSYANPFEIVLGLQSGSSNSNPVNIRTETDSIFYGSGASGSTTGCDAIYFYAFSDSALATAYLDSDISLTAADAISPETVISSFTTQYLTVNTASPFLKQFYLQGKNTGSKANSIQVTTIVCGGSETYVSSSSDTYSLTLQKQGVTTSNSELSISTSTHNGWFIETLGALSSTKCFTDKTYTLCASEPSSNACGNVWTQTSKVYVAGDIRIQLIPQYATTLYLLSYIDYIKISAHRRIQYTVCGLEEIKLKDESYFVRYEYELGSSVEGTNTTWYINSADFESYMYSTDTDCPLYLIDLVKDPVYTSDVLTSFNVSIRSQIIMETWGTNSNFNLRLETTAAFYWETFYFRGSTQSTNDTLANNALLQLEVQVINCTAEWINIMNNQTWTEISITQFTSTPYVTNIDDKNFKFNSSHSTFCPITEYEVIDVTDSKGKSVTDALDMMEMGDPLVTSAVQYNYYKNLMITNTSVIFSDYFIHIRAKCGLNASIDTIAARLSIVEGINFPPYFSSSLDSLVIDLNSANPFLQYTLPEVLDSNDHSFTISIGNLPTFGHLDQSTLTFSSLKPQDLGQYEIPITLIDEKFAEAEYVLKLEVINTYGKFMVTEETINQEEEVKEEVVNEEVKEKKEYAKVIAKIDEISSFGAVNVSFSERMQVNSSDVSWIDNSVLQIELIPYDFPPDLDPSELDFTWKVTRFEDTFLDLKLTFANPVYISLNKIQDILQINFNSTFFISEATLQPLFTYKISSKIKKQIPDNDQTKNFVSGTEKIDKILKYAFWFVLAFNVLMSGSEAMDYFIGLMNALQMVLHLPMLWVIMPGNVTIFFRIILPIVMFDVLDGLDDTKYDPNNLFQFDDCNQLDKLKFIEQMSDLGYKTSNSILNLGSLFILVMLYFIRIGLLIFFYLAVKCTGKGQQYYQKQVDALFFNEILLLMLEGYMEFLICGYLNFNRPDCVTEQSGEVLSVYLSYFCIISTLLIVPGFMIYLLTRKTETLQSEEFQRKYGSLYEGIKTDSKARLAYYFVFILRRMTFCFIAFGLSWQSIYQIQAVYLMNIFVSIYIGYFASKKEQLVNRIDLLNEFMIQAVTLHLVLFTDYIPLPELQYNLGYSMIGFISLLMLANILVVGYFAANDVWLIGVKYYRRARRMLDNNYMRKEVNNQEMQQSSGEESSEQMEEQNEVKKKKKRKVHVLEKYKHLQKHQSLQEIEEVPNSQESDRIQKNIFQQMDPVNNVIKNQYINKQVKSYILEQENVIVPQVKTLVITELPRFGISAYKIKKVKVAKMNRPWEKMKPILTKKENLEKELEDMIELQMREQQNFNTENPSNREGPLG